MVVNSTFAVMIIADIAGSTPLYKAVGDDEAQRLIQLEIDRLRAVLLSFGGIPVGQKGDDVLSYFESPSAAFQAALTLIEPSSNTPLMVRVGVHCGPIVVAEKGIFGEAVNITARFATAANPGEACVSQDVAALLPGSLRQRLIPLGQLSLKGVSDPLMAYSLIHSDSDQSKKTHLPRNFGKSGDYWQPQGTVALLLRHEGRTWRFLGDGAFTIGRSPDCDVVLPQPWVSRVHAILSIKAGKLVLTDRSTSGTFVKSESGREIQLKRETVMLADSGQISPALPIESSEARLYFELQGSHQSLPT